MLETKWILHWQISTKHDLLVLSGEFSRWPNGFHIDYVLDFIRWFIFNALLVIIAYSVLESMGLFTKREAQCWFLLKTRDLLCWSAQFSYMINVFALERVTFWPKVVHLAHWIGPIHEVMGRAVFAQNIFEIDNVLLDFMFLLDIVFVIRFANFSDAFAFPLDIAGSQSWRDGRNLFLWGHLNFLAIAATLFDLSWIFDHLLAKYFYFGEDVLISVHFLLLICIIKWRAWVIRSSVSVTDASRAIGFWLWTPLADVYAPHLPSCQFLIHHGQFVIFETNDTVCIRHRFPSCAS